MRKILSVLLVTLLCFSVLWSSVLWALGAYKWVDDQGIVHYSDRARGKPSSVINIPIAPGSELPPAPESTEQVSIDQSKASSAKPDKVALARERKIFKENCVKAKQQLATNQSLTRMYRLEGVERHYLTDTERDSVITRSQETVDYWCKSQP